MWWWTVMVVVLGALGASGGAWAQDVPPNEPLAYAVFSGSSARLGKNVRVYGPVGSNDTLRLGRRTRIDGLAAAPTIDLARKVQTGALFCVLVQGGDRPCLPIAPPVVSPGSLGVGLVLPGQEDVDVPRGAHRAPLAAGAYRDLEVGRGSALMLLGGDYLFDHVTLGRGATLTCATSCRVAVRKTLRIGRRASVTGLAGVGDLEIRFDVTGHRARAGVRLGTRATFAGIVWAPTTKVELGRKTKVGGSVQGADVRIGSKAKIGTPVEVPAG